MADNYQREMVKLTESVPLRDITDGVRYSEMNEVRLQEIREIHVIGRDRVHQYDCTGIELTRACRIGA